MNRNVKREGCPGYWQRVVSLITTRREGVGADLIDDLIDCGSTCRLVNNQSIFHPCILIGCRSSSCAAWVISTRPHTRSQRGRCVSDGRFSPKATTQPNVKDVVSVMLILHITSLLSTNPSTHPCLPGNLPSHRHSMSLRDLGIPQSSLGGNMYNPSYSLQINSPPPTMYICSLPYSCAPSQSWQAQSDNP